MKKDDNKMEDELRPEYDLKSLRVRKVGPKRSGFGEFVRLAPDVAEVFPNAESVNEALRFLIRVTRENNAMSESVNTGSWQIGMKSFGGGQRPLLAKTSCG